jgi:lipoprotein-releasing system ATP-binding protein
VNDCVLRASGLTKTYVTRAGALTVLDGVDLEVRAGEVLAIVGRSGAGKSTLLHCLGLLDAPTAGRLEYRGTAIGDYSAAQRARLRNRDFGFVFQFYHLLPEFTAHENVVLAAQVGSGMLGWFGRRAAARARATELLQRVGLASRLHHRPSQLSGGEQQRVAIARALMNAPGLLLCDEPTGNLDSATAAEVMALLFELNRAQGQTCVLVTHDESVARQAHRVVRLLDGRVERVERGGAG